VLNPAICLLRRENLPVDSIKCGTDFGKYYHLTDTVTNTCAFNKLSNASTNPVTNTFAFKRTHFSSFCWRRLGEQGM
jgi:hypothetical protein